MPPRVFLTMQENVYDIEKELPGLLGWRLIKVDPVGGLRL
jgi:hypothetical protein